MEIEFYLAMIATGYYLNWFVTEFGIPLSGWAVSNEGGERGWEVSADANGFTLTTGNPLTGGNLELVVTGSGFASADSNGFPTVGTITGIEVNATGIGAAPYASITGANISVAALYGGTMTLATLFSGPNTLIGSPQSDKLLLGFGGNDTISGNGGPDIITGGLGRDTLNGGPAGDDFDYNAVAESKPGAANRDTITGFTHQDDIDLRTIDAKPGPGNQAFVFIGAQTFAAHAGTGEVRIAPGNIVRVNSDADNAAELEIRVVGVALAAGDFLL